MTRSPLAAALDRLPSLRIRLGLLIVLAIGVTLVTMSVADVLGLRLRLAALAGLLFSLGAVHVVARGTISPLRQLDRAAARVAAGEHGVRVDVTGRDEVAQLGHAFNRMAAELEQTDRLRIDLVADAAHELRTPISALRAVLENDVDGVEAADPAALLDQVHRLGALTDRLLDLSRLEAGAATLRRRPVVLAELVDEARAFHAARPGDGPPASADPAGGAHVAAVVLDAPDDFVVDADPDRLRQVLDNLVENVRRHAPGSAVLIRARGTPEGGTRIEVEDHGPGLAPGDHERVFDRFARGDRSRTTTGSGLGLAICRSIVELHGGVVRAEPVEPHGCRIVLELP
ncbi:ATP-binding protein [Patulibacter sp. NPDC049589]|uniref:HAMP domain-containing sensor histidine kinase n=1 Tax=Patulibacter sp. NPDC049589 TaxID=3154731 RepID=UPI003429669C